MRLIVVVAKLTLPAVPVEFATHLAAVAVVEFIRDGWCLDIFTCLDAARVGHAPGR